MREIKFRFRYTDGKDWILRVFDLGEIMNGCPFEVLSDAPLLKHYRMDGQDQFTGLKDKNGKEIYEGDIIKYHYFYFADGSEIEKEYVCSVKYDDSFANFDAMDKEGFAHFLGNASDDGIEVIGNIYENQDLLC